MVKENIVKKALIFGVKGQDGQLLARLLLSKNYKVYGTSRTADRFELTQSLSDRYMQAVEMIIVSPTDFDSVFCAIQNVLPDEIYFLAAQSSVGRSFEEPIETLGSIVFGITNILESIKLLGIKTRIYNASSGECFGETTTPADELTAFSPKSPYGVAKCSAHWLVSNYRESYGIYAVNGILFNHESNLRPTRFVTAKIVDAACRISKGELDIVHLGNLDIRRDWGWAEEYVVAMWLMLQSDDPQDLVIASGRSIYLREFAQLVFSNLGLNSYDHIVSDFTPRPSDIFLSMANPDKAAVHLGWKASTSVEEIVERLVRARLTAIEI
jgi:GDPmannose 4,6-dehydratase